MKAILIDTNRRLISEIQVGNAYPDCNKAMGVDTIAVGANLPRGATLYVDDNGLCISGNPCFAFNPKDLEVGEYQDMFAGNGVLLGYDEENDENKDCPYSLMEVAEMVGWTNKVTR